MTVDPQVQVILDHWKKFNPQPLEKLSPDAARNNPSLKNAVEETIAESIKSRAAQLLKPIPEPVGQITHIQIPTSHQPLLARIFKPKGQGPFPVIVYFHGGGWVIGNLDSYESSCRALCNAADCMVVSVAYRLAPEAKYPAAVEDAYDSLQWILQNAQILGGDPKFVAVGGESAGGNLAAVCCLKAKKEKGFMPAAQLLIYPVTDARLTTASMNQFTDTQPLYQAMMPWFYGHYLEKEEQKTDPFVSPLLAEDLTGLPQAIVITAEFDPLRDEGESYAKRLSDAGSLFDMTRYPGMVHEFFGLAGVVDQASKAVENTANYLKDIFNFKSK